MESTFHYTYDETTGRYLILRGSDVLGFAPSEADAKAGIARLLRERLRRLAGGPPADAPGLRRSFES